jgi:putative tricarboxylic transport membrane protein
MPNAVETRKGDAVRISSWQRTGKRRSVAAWGALTTLALSLFLLAGCSGGGSDGSGSGNASGEDYPSEPVEMMVPADPGGGYDQTARSMQRALTDGEVIQQDAEVYNVSGGSGTVGLTQFVSENAGNPQQLMIMGKILVGSIQQTDAQVDLSQTTPIARLTAEYDGIVVPADSEYENLEQLVKDFKENPGSVSWGGGSVGGVDQILVAQLAEEVGVDPSEINYVPYAGGGELAPAILSGDVSAAASGLAEFQDQIESGEMRLLAVSSDEPIEGVDAPTIKEAGYDVSIANWRGVVAPPDISEEQRAAAVSMVEEMHETEQWQEALEANNWEDFLMTGQEFEDYIQQEDEDITQTLKDLGIVE